METAAEYKERLLRMLTNDSERARRNKAYFERELAIDKNDMTDANIELLENKITELDVLANFLTDAALKLEDVEFI